MEVFQREKNLCSIELGLPQRKLFSLNMKHEITTTDVLHDEVDSGLCLEARVEA